MVYEVESFSSDSEHIYIYTVLSVFINREEQEIFEIETFDYRGKIWEWSFTMVVVASSAITVIEDFSKDTLGRYDTVLN